ncbi:MAG: hypothetical protein ACON35_00780 [Candidatus Marinamargulisbacteria bacterium]
MRLQCTTQIKRFSTNRQFRWPPQRDVHNALCRNGVAIFKTPRVNVDVEQLLLVSSDPATLFVSPNGVTISDDDVSVSSVSMLNSLAPSLQFFQAVLCASDFPTGPPTTFNTHFRMVALPLKHRDDWYFPTTLHRDSGKAMQITLFEDARVFKQPVITRFYGLLDQPCNASYAIEVAARLADEIAIYDNDATIGVTELDINLNRQLLMRESTTSSWQKVAVDDADVELHYEGAKAALVGQPLKLFHQVELPSMTSECHGPKLQRLSVQVNT